jgi:hypothetical protein
MITGGNRRVSLLRHRFAWVALLVSATVLTALAGPASAGAKKLQVVKATPEPSAGTLGVAARHALDRGYLVPDQRAYERAKARAAVQRRPSGAALAAPSLRQLKPSTTKSWSGQSDSDFAPSDSTGAVGTQRFIQLVNSKFAIYEKDSTTPISTGSLNTLANASSADTLFDVQVIWDPTTKRFYYTMIDVVSQTQNELAYGYSKDATPSGGSSSDWCKYSISYGSQFPDYPKLGDSKYYALIGVNVFSGNFFTGADAIAINKPSGSGCQSSPKITVKSDLMHNDSTPASTPVPANEIDSIANGWIVAVPSSLPSKKIDIFKVQKENGDAKIQKTATKLQVGDYSAPPNAPQSGNSTKIDTLDGRFTQAVGAKAPNHNDKFAVWTQHTVSGGAGSKVRWYEIKPSEPATFQKGSASSSSKYDFDGAISPNRAVKGSDTSGGKNMVMNFVASSSSSFPTIKMVSKKGGDDQSGQVAVKQSPGPIAGFDCSESGEPCRWGDYAAATPDPSNGSHIWNVSQWASGDKPACTTSLNCPATWRTQIFIASP